MTVRECSWDNQFYPSDSAKAQSMWEVFFAQCKNSHIEESIRAIQVPHAGWVYSGQAAAEAYIQLKDKDIDTVIMIGPQHRMPVNHIQVFPEGVWESPLGNLEVNAEIAARLIDYNPSFKPDTKAHQAEHSLEVQIAPLVMIKPQVKIVPLLTAPYQRSLDKILADSLAEIVSVNQHTMILVSTDLYHGESYDDCKASDNRTIEYIQSLDGEGLSDAFSSGLAAACGESGLVALLTAAVKIGINEAHMLAAYNSNDVTGQHGGYVVGYSSFAFT